MKYPRLFAIGLTIIIAVLIFGNEKLINPQSFLVIENYLSSFTLGALYTYGFTAALSTGALLTIANQQNIYITGVIAGLGALMGDLLIFKFVRGTFNEELNELRKTRLIKKIRKFLKMHTTLNKAVPLIAYVIIASPLPAEIGVSLAAMHKDTSTKLFSILSFILNTIGIFIILIIGRYI